jgi:outer membrane protein OmpA-like peptidoglycan-associated protein
MNHHDIRRATPALRRTAMPLTALAIAALGACSSMPDRNAALDQARQRLEMARSESTVATLAPEELGRAGTAFAAAEEARRRGDDRVQIDHLAYLANQRVTVAQEAAAERSAQAVTANASAERDRMRLALRTAEADGAQRQLAAATHTNARTTQELANAQQSNERKNQQLAQASATSQADGERLARRDAQVGDLQAQLQELNARPTPRGMVVTLGDVLFDSGRAQLKGDGGSTMVKLSDFLKRNPQRTATIEGYTDSVGTYVANQDLASQRAKSVLSALLQLGVTGDRLATQAFGEENPVGDNKTAAGRQANRRVEVVFSSTAADLLIKK